jgi:hypothetical protein
MRRTIRSERGDRATRETMWSVYSALKTVCVGCCAREKKSNGLGRASSTEAGGQTEINESRKSSAKKCLCGPSLC